jgi:hypothetical protein
MRRDDCTSLTLLSYQLSSTHKIKFLVAISCAMSYGLYSSLSLEPGSIRLLRLMPDTNETAPIQCQLFNYTPQESSKKTHRYEALSYLWGDPDQTLPIFVNEYPFNITVNLHAALSRLRDPSFELVIWVDAICINQADDTEKVYQIQSMAKIYGQANRVVVWLGEANDDSGQALEAIRVAPGNKSTNILDKGTVLQAIIALLQRPWFRRIWVRHSIIAVGLTKGYIQIIQEVAAARHVLIMCGSTEIDGYAFCLGLELFKGFFKDYPGLQGPIDSVTYLIRGAIFRPKYATSTLGRVSLDICLLGELMDMYHTHKATIRHDKVYALLGMSSDNLSKANLSPNYGVPWKELLQRLVKFLLYEQISVETWDNRELAIIKSKGGVIGQVSSVVSNWDGRQEVHIDFKNIPEHLGWTTPWTLQATAKSVQEGDLVCHLQGASAPTLIRPCEDYFEIIMTIATPPKTIRTDSGCDKPPEPPQSIRDFSCDFLLLWNWETSSGHLQNGLEYETMMEINGLVTNHSERDLERAIRLSHVAVVLEDSEAYEGAEHRLREAIGDYERVLGKEHPDTLTALDNLGMIYKKKKQWKESEDLVLELLETRKRVQGVDHPGTLNSIANLVSIYRDQGFLDGIEDLDVMRNLIKRKEDAAQIKEKEVVQIANLSHRQVMKLLLMRRGEDVKITEEVVVAAAGNYWYGIEMMRLLFKRRGDNVKITEEVVKAAARNEMSGWGVMTLLLDQRGEDVKITEEVVIAAAGNYRRGNEVMRLLLRKRGDEVKITEEVVKAAARNEMSGWGVMTLLFDQRGEDVKITEEVVIAAAGNERCGVEVMMLLFDQRGDDVKTTEEVLIAAAKNRWRGKEVVTLLLNKRRGDIEITEEVVIAAAGNERCGGEVMMLLLDQRGDDVKITKEVVKAAAGNERCGVEVMMLLFDQRGDDVKITEEVLIAAAKNRWRGKEVVTLLLNKRRGDIEISEEVVIAAAGNERCGGEVMMLLLDQRGDDVKITEEVVKEAAGNGESGKEVMTLLLDRRGEDVKIIEEVGVWI